MNRTFDYPGLRILEAFFDDPHSEVHLREGEIVPFLRISFRQFDACAVFTWSFCAVSAFRPKLAS